MRRLCIYWCCFAMFCPPAQADDFVALRTAWSKTMETREDRLQARITELEQRLQSLTKPQYRTVTKTRRVPYTTFQRVKICHGSWCEYVNQPVTAYRMETYTERVPIASQPPEAAPTPESELQNGVGLVNLPRGSVILEPGCGADARLAIALAKAGYSVLAFEIDPGRYRSALDAIHAAGYGNGKAITLINGDCTRYSLDVDGVLAYMYPETLARIQRKLTKRTKRIVSYMHTINGLTMRKSGDFYVWSAPVTASVVPQQRMAMWGGQYYTGPLCNSPGCAMCASIRRQLGIW